MTPYSVIHIFLSVILSKKIGQSSSVILFYIFYLYITQYFNFFTFSKEDYIFA